MTILLMLTGLLIATVAEAAGSSKRIITTLQTEGLFNVALASGDELSWSSAGQ